MFHKIKDVTALPNYELSVQFSEGITKIYDVKPLIKNIKMFEQLKENELFFNVEVDVGGYGVIWNDDIDISCDEIYENGKKVNTPFDGLMAFGDATMIDIKKSKELFNKFTKKYDLTNSNLERKYHHSYRVMVISRQIAESLNLNEEQIEIATLIGLLHDIARFEQYTKFQTFNDKQSFDHGDYGVKVLKENNYIRKYIEDNKYDHIILKAIKNHNKLYIEEGLTEEELLFAKIIRDADKLDIMYESVTLFNSTEEEKNEVENGIISDKALQYIRNNMLVIKEKEYERIDGVIVNIAFTFDLNFKYSYEYLARKDYINLVIDRYNFKNEKTKLQIEEIREIVNKFINEKI